MSSIDERVVEMRFDNKQFESNMQTTLGSLDKLRQALKFDNASNSLKSVEDGARKIDLSSIQSSLENISSKFTAFGILGVETFRRVANAAIDLGQKMATAVTTQPLKQGFAEYELQMNSVKTIMASTGKDVDTVNGYLDELNTYADKTIYSFSDMTANIGKFTNAGVDLDLAVKAIQGISNEAAVSGANTNEASRAMYNFAQALSAGYVKLIDWKSIENANMATVEFKNQLLETALACGTVERTSDGMYRTLTTNAQGKVSEAFDATHSFNDALANQWMTTEVLTQTLAKYADETTDIGKKAFAAAQDVTTFSQLIDTTKEALGSGWTKTFQYLIGNFDEAKELWSAVSKAINGVVDSTSDARNELLKSWNELGGRRHLIQALGKAFNYLAGIMHPVKVAFREIFPAVTVKNLMDLTKHIWRFTDSLKLSVASGSNVYKTFRGLFSAVDIVKQAFVAVIRVIADTVKGFTGVGDGVLGVTGKLGDFIYGLRNALKENDTFYKGLKRVADFIVGVLSKAFDILKTAAAGIESAFNVDLKIPTFEEAVAVFKNLTKVLEPLKNALDKAKESIKGFFDSISNGLFGPKPDTGQVEETVSIFTRIGTAVQNLWNQIKPLLDPIKNAFKTIFGSFLDPLGHVDFNKVFSAISGGAFSGVAIKIFEIFNNFKKSTDGIKDGFENFGEILDGLKGSLENFQQGIKAKAIKDIAIAVGILAASLVILSGVDDQKLASGLMTISGMLAALLGTFTLFSDMTKTLKPGNMTALAGSMIPLSVAVGILVISLRGLASLDIGQLAKGLVGVGVLMLEVGSAAAVLGRLKLKGFMSAATSMIMLGVAIRTLVKPVAILGSIDYGVLQQGLEGVGKLLASLAIFAFFAKFGKVGISTGAGILLVAEAIKVLSLSVAAFGYTPVDVVNQGLGAVAALLTELAIFSVITGNAKHVLSTAASMVVLSAALEIMAGVINATGTMNYDQMSQGLGAIASTLLIMSVALLATKNALPGAAALIVTAGALAILTPVLMALGKLTLPEIGKGLLAIGGALAIVGVAGALLGPAALGVVALAGGIALIGVGVAAAGAGLLMLSAAFASVGASATVFAGSMVAAVSIVITGLLGIIPQIVQIVGATISGIVSIIATNGPIIVATAIGIASMIIGGIGILLPQLVDTGIKIVLSIMDGISQNIEKITTLAVAIIIKFANGISSMMDALVQAGINLMVNFINGMANGIRNNTEVILSAVGNLMGAIVEFSLTALQSIVQNIPLIGDELYAGLETVKGEVRTRFSPEEMQQIGADGMGGVAAGIRETTQDAANAANEVGDAAVAALEEKKPLYSQTSSGSVMEYATGFINSKKDVVDSVSGLNDDAIAGLKVPDEYANVGDINVNALLEKMRGKAGDASKVGEDIKKPILDTLTDEAGFNASGTTNMTAYLEGANSKATEANTTGTTISTAVTTGLESQIPAQKTAGETGGQTYSDAVKSKEPEARAAAETISTAVTKRMDEEVSKHKEEGTKSGDAYKQSILDKETEIVDAVDTVSTSATDKLEEKVQVYEEKGDHSAEGYRTSIENKKEDITKTAEEVADSAAEGMDSKYDRFVQVGEHATMGFVEGMRNKIREAARAAAEIAAAAYEAAMDELDENSPSKVFMGIGEYAGEGMVIGLNNMAEDASDSGRNLAGGAIESARKAIAQISKALDEDLDTVPTIAPVLDLTNIQNGVGRLKGMLGQTTYGINAVGTANVTNRSEGFANAIAEALNRKQQQPIYVNNTNRMILDGKVIAESVNVQLGGML